MRQKLLDRIGTTAGWTSSLIERWLASKMDWIVLVPLVAGFALRFKFALGTYLNPDEALHYVLVNQGSFAGAYEASLTNAHPPLYFALLYYWRFVGNSEVMLRLPSILASTAAGWMAYRWIATALGRAAGVITLLLLTFSPIVIALGAEVRGYSLLLLWMASALYFLERAFRGQTVSSIAYSALFLYLAILTHYSAIWFVLAAEIYGLFRISSLNGRQRIEWVLFQVGGVAIYAWLYLVHISQLRGSPMEAEAATGWLRALYFRAGDSPVAFLQRATVDVFQYFFGHRHFFNHRFGGRAALVIFVVAVVWLVVAGLRKERRALSAFGLLLLLPFVFGMAAALLDFYPYGGTRHCFYLVLFATAGVSFPIAAISRQRLLPILLLALLIAPFWRLPLSPDPQQMARKEQTKELMVNAMAALRTTVPPSEPVFSDYQASILLAYYLGRDHAPPPPRECGGATEAQFGPYRVVILNVWSATAAQLVAGLERWRMGCESAPRDSLWIFDGGWGLNLVDDLTQSAPGSISQGQRFGQTISLFKLRLDR